MKRTLASILLSIASIFTFTQAAGAAVDTPPVDECSIVLAYRAVFNRAPDAEGLQYWYDVGSISHLLTAPEEADLDPTFWYQRVLGRNGGVEGTAYWRSFDPAHALNGFVHTEEVRASGFCVGLPELTRSGPVIPAGWVDGGNGVAIPAIMAKIRNCESGGSYTAKNSISTASGAYQFLNSSWEAYGHDKRYGVSQARYATPAQQDKAAVITWERDGTRPWNASSRCWN